MFILKDVFVRKNKKLVIGRVVAFVFSAMVLRPQFVHVFFELLLLM